MFQFSQEFKYHNQIIKNELKPDLVAPLVVSGIGSDKISVKPTVKWSDESELRNADAFKSFGLVMNRIPFLCIDVDGKNGAFDNIKTLYFLSKLPQTLVQQSKSGSGIHIFLRTDYPFKDIIGYMPGVDIKCYGLVYCLEHQLNNGHSVAGLPAFLDADLKKRDYAKEKARIVREHEEELTRLRLKRLGLTAEAACDYWCDNQIPEGNRNNIIFAVSMKIKSAGGDWESHLEHMCHRSSLPSDEAQALKKSVARASQHSV